MGVVAQATAVGSTDVWYEILLYLHILVAIIGFGAVFLNGLYGAQSQQRGGSEGLAISEATFKVSGIADYFIYAVFVTGLLMGITAEEPLSLGDTWLSISMLLFIIAVGLAHGVLRPSVKKMNANMAAMIEAEPTGGPPPQAAEMEALGKKVAASGAALNLIVIVILYLMVWKPGLI